MNNSSICMKGTQATKEEVYTASPFIWDNPYAVISNKDIMDKIEDNLHHLGIEVVSENYRAARTKTGIIKGVIGEWNLASNNSDFGTRLAFRNSYDKSMSFAFVIGGNIFVCSNGMIRGDYGLKRVHKGVAFDDAMKSIDDGFESVNKNFNILEEQIGYMKEIKVDKELSYKLIGDLFFEQSAISLEQLNVVKRELFESENFLHINDEGFNAYSLYNAVTESLKSSHPLNYVKNHTALHTLFENQFNLPGRIIEPTIEEVAEFAE